MQQAIKVLQQKLAAVLQELAGSGTTAGGGDVDVDGNEDGFGAGGPRSPDGLANGSGTQYEPEGFTTPYVNPGATSAWGGGAATPYGAANATPYRTSGWNA